MSHDDFPTDRPAVVTCGLPYANGDLHIGHLRTYVGGDVYSRALEQLGQETAFVSGSDMHGTPVAVNAEQEGVSPEQFALDWHERYAETFPKFNVDFDNYGHTHDETNTEITQQLVRDLDEAGHLYEKEIMVAYDPVDDQYLPDRYVEGTCPYCGAHARGDECDEGCQRHLEPGEVEDPESTITGNPAEYRERTHQFFAVSEFADYLSDFLDRLEGTSNARNQPREWIEQGLQDWCITRDMDWGIDLPGENPQDLVLYVWVDAPIEYISSTKQYTERVGADAFDWETAWKEGVSDDHPEGGEIVHVIGRDIIQHHTIFWPAMLEATDHAEPRAVMASGFVTLDGKGFSTSRDRAVWADEYLDEGFHPDPLRYYLATNGGFQQDVDFSWEKFAERVNTELVGTVGNFLYRSLLFAHRNYENGPNADAPSDDVAARIDEAVDEFAAAVNDYSVRALGDAVTDLARFGNEYIQRNEPWKLVDEEPAEAEQVIYDCVALAKAIAVLFEPLAPEKSERLWAQLGEPGTVHDATVEAAREGPAGDLSEPTELFEQVEDERVEDLNEKLEARVAESESSDDGDESDDENDDQTDTTDDTDMTDIEPLSDDRISFDDFQELDIRVGRIEEAEGIEGADDLVKLTVDLGAETRTIVAGLKQLHDVDDLPDTKVIVLANMEKAELFGVESNGMVLAAGEDADLLTTYEDAGPGTKVK